MLFSSKGDRLEKIANIFEKYPNTVSSWIDQCEEHGVRSVHDRPRSGAPVTFTAAEREDVKRIITDHPHAPKRIFATLAEQLKKTIRISTLQRIIKKTDFVGNESAHPDRIQEMNTRSNTRPKTSTISNKNNTQDE